MEQYPGIICSSGTFVSTTQFLETKVKISSLVGFYGLCEYQLLEAKLKKLDIRISSQADQPYNATIMSRNHKAAFELLMVRTGDDGVRLPYRYKDASTPPSFTSEGVKAELRTVLKHTRGEEGASIRKNFAVLADAMGNAWNEGGDTKVDFDNMMQKFV